MKANNPYQTEIKLALFIIAFVILFFTVKSTIKAVTNDKSHQDKKQIEPSKLTYSLPTYNGFAERLKEAFSGWGTDEDEVLRVIKSLKNASDWYQLKRTFGYNVEIPHVFGSIKGDLVKHLSYELEDNAETKNKVRSYLQSIGVNDF